ncbi:hypothetical protein Amal_01477 [Acetobacter malorum]|uniref:Uncharacterized protein n=1 Tax=Acetobacter malorum TaxID=178901 RepID=A0A177GC27_9PROT|nr:hypothetical protein Amal_01477 [Acetobacter malorum]
MQVAHENIARIEMADFFRFRHIALHQHGDRPRLTSGMHSFQADHTGRQADADDECSTRCHPYAVDAARKKLAGATSTCPEGIL